MEKSKISLSHTLFDFAYSMNEAVVESLLILKGFCTRYSFLAEEDNFF